MGRSCRCWEACVRRTGGRPCGRAIGSWSRTWIHSGTAVSCRSSGTRCPNREGTMQTWMWIPIVLVGVLGLFPLIVSAFLRNVDAGTVRLVSWLNGFTAIYRGPGKSKEIPLLTTGTSISSKVINVDLDITDQTADVDEEGTPRPIKVRVLASAIVSVGDSDVLIRTAANRFFSKSDADQLNTLTDLLSSSGRRAINLLTHDQLFSAKAPPGQRALGAGTPANVLPVRAA